MELLSVQFNNSAARILGLCTGHKLMPGKHKIKISKKDLQTALANKSYQGWASLGWVSVVQPQVAPVASAESTPDDPPQAESLLEGVLLPDAKALIGATADIELLSSWAKDPRKGVQAAVQERLEALKASDAEPDQPIDDGSQLHGDVGENPDQE